MPSKADTPCLFLTGASGYLGHAVVARLEAEGIAYVRMGREEGFNLAAPFSLDFKVEEVFAALDQAPLMLHMAAQSSWLGCEAEPELAMRVNAEATGALSFLIRRFHGRMLFVSTDLVFDGEAAPYSEDALPKPQSSYGKSKAEGERLVLMNPRNLVVRLPLLCGPSHDGTNGASDMVLHALAKGNGLRLFDDEWRTALSVSEAARKVVALVFDPELCGIQHLPGEERMSRYEFGLMVAKEAGLDASLLHACSRCEMDGPPRPKDCSLATLRQSV